MRLIDLTAPLNAYTFVYEDVNGSRDPAYSAEPWATIAEHGYSVHRLEMGTHTGTHIDAPAHFHVGARTVDQILPDELAGPAVVIDVRSLARVTAAVLRPYSGLSLDGGVPLFLVPDSGVLLSEDAVAAVISWQPRVILFTGQFLDEHERYHHNRAWLGADIPLVTDLQPRAAARVRDGDLLIVAPLALEGMDGAPCRVFAVNFGANP
jgi:kynurenine formamidase